METAFDFFAAFNQAMWIFGGLIFLLIGGAIVAAHFYTRTYATRYKARIKGLRVKGADPAGAPKPNYGQEMYYPVYEYTTRQGQSFLAESDSGSNMLGGKEPGRQVHILVMPGNPEKASEEGYVFLFIGIVIAGMAAVLFSIAFGAYKTSMFTFIALAGVIAYAASRFVTSIIPPEQRGTMNEWKERKRAEFRAKRENLPMIDHNEYLKRRLWWDGIMKKWIPFYILIALGLGGIGAYIAQDIMDKINNGYAAEGVIARLESDTDSDGTTYYVVAQFKNAAGGDVEFKDSIGASTPLYSPGEKVKILYDPSKPMDAMIDRGKWNWVLPGGFLGAALLILLTSLKSYAGIARRANRR